MWQPCQSEVVDGSVVEAPALDSDAVILPLLSTSVPKTLTLAVNPNLLRTQQTELETASGCITGCRGTGFACAWCLRAGLILSLSAQAVLRRAAGDEARATGELRKQDELQDDRSTK